MCFLLADALHVQIEFFSASYIQKQNAQIHASLFFPKSR